LRNGYTVVEPAAVIATHLTEIIKSHAPDLLGRQEVKELLDGVRDRAGAVVDELVPSTLSVGGVQKVLAGLLRERVSIRDLVTILETLADHAGSLAMLQEVSVDTMPLDAALGSYALLGGFKPSPDRRPRSPGQRRAAVRALTEALERQARGLDGEPQAGSTPVPQAEDREGTRLLRWVDGLPPERLTELHVELFSPLQAGSFGFLDSIRLASRAPAPSSDWKAATGSERSSRRATPSRS